jgi:hypothetical protein
VMKGRDIHPPNGLAAIRSQKFGRRYPGCVRSRMSQSTRHRVAEEIDSLDKDKSLPFTEILDAAMVACMVDLPIIGL